MQLGHLNPQQSLAKDCGLEYGLHVQARRHKAGDCCKMAEGDLQLEVALAIVAGIWGMKERAIGATSRIISGLRIHASFPSHHQPAQALKTKP